MPNFELGNPEEEGVGVIERARLRDLYKYAKAFGVPYTVNCKKDALVPIMKDAEARGVFTKPCPHPEFLGPPSARRALLAEQPVAAPVDVPTVVEPNPNQPLTMKWRGPSHKYCIMQGEEVISTGHSKEEAQGLV
jgi:hypothetical protein